MSSRASESNPSGFVVGGGSGYRQYDKKDVSPSAATTVPEKYQGTRADQDDMVLLGKKQVLRRNFKFTTILGFASTGKRGRCQNLSVYVADISLSTGRMGDATGVVGLRSTGRRYRNRILGIDRRCHWHDFCLHILGRDGINVSSGPQIDIALVLTTLQVSHSRRYFIDCDRG